MRPLLVLLHRWLGLFMAVFLFISGLTGAIISWDHELDDLLNPHLTEVASRGAAIPSLELARQAETRDPRAWVTYMPLVSEAGESLALWVEPRVNPATNKLYELGYNQVFVDPVTGTELGKREWGAVWPVTRENFVSFLYVLHYSLHIPEMWGVDRWGMWLLGTVAIIWTLDCFVGFYLTLPVRRRQYFLPQPSADEQEDNQSSAPGRTWWQRWRPAWKVRWSGGSYKLNFDLHRAFSLWTWVLLFILAFTAFSLNLYREIFFPSMSLVSDVTPSPFDLREPADKHQPIIPAIGYTEIIEQAKTEAQHRGWTEPVGDVFYAEDYGIYGVRFFHLGDDHGAAGVGPAELYFDGKDGRYLGDHLPWQGTAADIFVQIQFPLHSGRILGLPGRILISVMGVVVAMLSITGIVIWWRKRRLRVGNRARRLTQPDSAVEKPLFGN